MKNELVLGKTVSLSELVAPGTSVFCRDIDDNTNQDHTNLTINRLNSLSAIELGSN